MRIPKPGVKINLVFEFYEMLFAIYFWGFILMRPLLHAYESKSTLILFCYVLLLLSLFIAKMIQNKDNKLGEAVFFMLFIFILLLLDAIFRNNSYSFTYLYRFTYTGIIPVLLLSKVRNPEKVLYYFTWLSLIVFLLYGIDPIHGFGIFENYMDYGFNLAMPAFIGIFLGSHYFKIRWMTIFEILCFICILIFANRSSLLSIIIFVFLYFFFFSLYRKRNVILWTIPITGIIIFLYLNAEVIIQYIYNVVVIKLKINSYTLNNLTGMLKENINYDMFSGRKEIWNKAHLMINENILFGHGMGKFQDRYGFYSHNIYLDFLLFFGVLGLICFTLLIFYSLIKIYKSKGTSRILGLLFLSVWFPKLFFSNYFLEDIGFWCFLSFPFICIYFNKKIDRKFLNS